MLLLYVNQIKNWLNMIIATVVIAIFAGLAFFISLGNAVYLFWRNHWQSVNFFAEIKLIKKDEKRIHDESEEVNLYLVNQGCPITIMEICFDQTKKKTGRKMHISQLPIRLERGEVLKIPKKDFPIPVNMEKIIDKKVRFYAIDSFKNKYVMNRKSRKAPPHQPYLSQSDD